MGKKNYSLGSLFLNDLDLITYGALVKGYYKLEFSGAPVVMAVAWLRMIKMGEGVSSTKDVKKVRSSGIICS